MKKRLLLLLASICAGTAFAQNYAPDYRFSIGLYGGISPTTKLMGELTDYTNKDRTLPAIVGIMGHYNINDRLQVGLDINMNSEWSSKGTSTLMSQDGKQLGDVTVKYLAADRVFSTTGRVNWMIPTYDNLKNNRSNFYYGLAVGGIFTVNDGSNVYSQFDQVRGENSKYVSEYHFEAAAGYTLGFQIGAEWYSRTHWGFNLEFAPRFSHLNVVDGRSGNRNGPFDVFTFPMTVGVRYRFGRTGYF
jgi:hypothetical protein